MKSKRFIAQNRGFTLVELMIVVAIIGILASIAIPSYFKYIWRARSVEALTNLGTMGKAAMAYFVSEHADSAGGILNPQWPADSWTYTAVTNGCANQPNMKCPGGSNGDDSLFAGVPTWQSLNFSVDDPHYYTYIFSNDGPRPATALTASNAPVRDSRGHTVMLAWGMGDTGSGTGGGGGDTGSGTGSSGGGTGSGSSSGSGTGSSSGGGPSSGGTGGGSLGGSSGGGSTGGGNSPTGTGTAGSLSPGANTPVVAWCAAYAQFGPVGSGLGIDQYDVRLAYDPTAGQLSNSAITSYREAGLQANLSPPTTAPTQPTGPVSSSDVDGGKISTDDTGFNLPSGNGDSSGGGSLASQGFSTGGTSDSSNGGSLSEDQGFSVTGAPPDDSSGGGSMSEDQGFNTNTAPTDSGNGGSMGEDQGFSTGTAADTAGAGSMAEDSGFVAGPTDSVGAATGGFTDGTVGEGDNVNNLPADNTDLPAGSPEE